MATSTIAPASVETACLRYGRAFAHRAGRTLEYWHLFSFDAPTVAVLWTIAFAASAHVRLPIAGPIMLAMATWLLYVADRLLDAARPGPAGALQLRHHFHAHYRAKLLAVSACLLPLLTWLVATRLDPAPRREDLVLCGCAMLYLLCVHLPSRAAGLRTLRLPKELFVGIIFAAACVIPTWSRGLSERPALLLPACLFALLCWLNCAAIEFWESGGSPSGLHASTLWIGRHLRGAGLALFTAALCAEFALPGSSKHQAAIGLLYLSIAASALAIVSLDRRRPAMSQLRLRAAADAALLTPALLLPALAALRTLFHHLHA